MSETEERITEAVKTGDTVKIHFTCKLEDGTIFDTSAGKEPLDFVVGEHQVMQGFEDAVLGMTKGESKSVIIPPEKAFGPHLKEKVHTVARDQFPRELEPAVGMKFEIKQEDDTTTVVRVTDLSESSVTLDTNDPLAGRALLFDIEVVEIQPSKVDYAAAEDFYKKGVDLQDEGQIDEAISSYQKAIGQNPKHTGAYYNLGVAFQRKGLIDQAIIYYEIAIGFDQEFTDAHHNLGVAFNEKGSFDEALVCFQRVLQLKPDHEGAYYNLGNTLVAKGQFNDAMLCYKKAIEINPEHTDAHWSLGLINLRFGKFDEGWKEYEWRWKLKDVMQQRNFTQPLWDGYNINGRIVLLHAEQGFGDTIQFIRYVPLVTQRAARVIVECQKELVSLLRNVDGIQNIVPYGETLPAFDVHCPLLSLPLIFGTKLETIPAKIPYISADPTKVTKWRDKIGSDGSTVKIGLAWAGNPRPKFGHSRSCSLKAFSPLTKSDTLTFVSLQKGEAAEQAKNPPEGMKLVDHTEEIQDFSDTAAIIETLDLVISVDTAVAHLAGSLGKPVWILLPIIPVWRWMINREDSPWYPTMRLFRQPSQGDWESVIAHVKEAFKDFIGS